MPDNALVSVPAAEEQFVFQAYSAPVLLNLRQIREKLSFTFEHTERFNPDCLICHRRLNHKIFVFKYGTIVFFNIPPEEHDHFLSAIGITPQPQSNEDERDELTEENFIVKVVPGMSQVGFNFCVLPSLDTARLQIVAQILAQSSALEIIEREVAEFLAESEAMTAQLKRGIMMLVKRARLLKFLGKGLSARHRILTQLALLSEPETTWEKEDLDQIYRTLFTNFDIKERIEKVEKTLALYTEVSALLLEIANTRRFEIMEAIIILLILIEVIRLI